MNTPDYPSLPDGFDVNTPSIARVYDYLLGGKDNFAVDRAMAHEAILKIDPHAPDIARANREFGARAVDYIAFHGITQYLDLGSGIPTSPPSVHDIVFARHRHATVVYVDNDPIVNAHNRALRAVHPTTSVVSADIGDINQVLCHPAINAAIDWTRPVAVLLLSVLQNIEHAHDLMTAIRDAIVPGSWLAISHLATPSNEQVEAINEVTNDTGYPIISTRDHDAITGLFGDFTIPDPGVVDITTWRRSPNNNDPETAIHLEGAVAVKPDRR